MERIYFISGLDCANCAAKLERHLREITYFDNVIIDFMAQKLILTAKDTEALQKGLQEALQVIARVEPGVTIAEKAKMKKSRASQTRIRQVTQDAHCGCDYKHEITQDTHCHDEHCSCGHEHHHNHEEHTHHHDGYCSCGHEHHHAHEEHIHQHNEHCHCGQEHYHEHEELMYNEVSAVAIEHVQKKDGRFTNEMKQGLVKISISTVLFFAALLLDSSSVLQLGVYLLAYFIVGSEVLLRAAKNILRGQVFDENFLMSIATVGAFCIGEYPEGVMVMLLYQLGELFQNYAVQRSRRSIAELMDIKPEVAHIKMSGQYIDVEPEEVTVGDIIQVRPGERIPLDGIVLEGHSALNTVALTGESVPREVGPQEVVMSGCINTSGVLLIQVEKEYDDSTVAKILDLVENASSKKAETENFITRFARFYTPIVVVIAAILAVVPPMILHEPFSGWVYRALVFLVISCPCALVISIPLTFFSGLGVCSRHGVLVKGSNYLEALAQMETAVFDKTGTLTQGQFTVTEVHPIFMAEHELLYYAACAESISNHPIAEAIRKANQQSFTADVVQRAEELAGHGVSAMIEGHHVLAGNYRLMEQYQIDFNRVDAMDTIVYIAIDRVFRGWIRIADTVKADAKEMVAQLKTLGVHNIVMLTGDNQNVAEQVAKQLGITKIFSQLLPGDKVACLEQLLAKK
ncbi:MAG: cadmium-translocating P-type ATPase, partial [Peptococcaceae bacterium]|nr:cadmium-translocating P-type ATPase [Peptococcaceae bacterium]